MGKIMVEITKVPSAKVNGFLVKVLILCRACDVDRVWNYKTGKILSVPTRTLKTAKFKCYKCGSLDVKVIHGKELQNRSEKYWGAPPSRRYMGRKGPSFEKHKRQANRRQYPELK